jgi:hypothetical protein
LVSLEKEIDAACAYLFVLDARHPGALKVSMPTLGCEPNLTGCFI